GDHFAADETLPRFPCYQLEPSVINQQTVTRLHRFENFGVRKVNAASVARFGIVVERELLADFKRDFLFSECSDAELRSLEVGENRDGAFDPAFHIADASNKRAHRLVVRVAHVNTKDVRACLIKLLDHCLVRGSRTECGKDLYLTTTPHWPDAPVTAASSAVWPSVS